MRQWGTSEIVKWLESAEGESWSREHHNNIPPLLMEVKDDLMGDYCWIPVFTRWEYNAENHASGTRPQQGEFPQTILEESRP